MRENNEKRKLDKGNTRVDTGQDKCKYDKSLASLMMLTRHCSPIQEFVSSPLHVSILNHFKTQSLIHNSGCSVQVPSRRNRSQCWLFYVWIKFGPLLLLLGCLCKSAPLMCAMTFGNVYFASNYRREINPPSFYFIIGLFTHTDV